MKTKTYFAIFISFFLLQNQTFAQKAEIVHYPTTQQISEIQKFTDDFFIIQSSTETNFVNLIISYSGGCTDHEFYIVHKQSSIKNSKNIDIYIYHDSKQDKCKAICENEVKIDLSKLGINYKSIINCNIIDPRNNKIIKTIAINKPVENFPKVNILQAESIIKSEFYKNHKGKFKITDLTGNDIWEKMNTQIFRVESTDILFYTIHNNKATKLGGNFSYDLTYIIADIDNDHNYECIYTYQFGSGVSRGILGIFSTTEVIKIGESCIIPTNYPISNFEFEKITDNEVKVQIKTPNEIIKQGSFTIEKIENFKILEIK